jgi:hypothetical protein
VRVVLDTNVLVSALLVESSTPGQLVKYWRQGRFDLITASAQLEELTQVTRYPKIRARLHPVLAGRLVNELRDVAVIVDNLPEVDVSEDPYDNYLLALADAGRVDYLVTGDKAHLLGLKRYGGARIVSVRQFMSLAKLPLS